MTRLDSPAIPFHAVAWPSCVRLIPCRLPPGGAYRRIAPPEDQDRLADLEALTNDRAREEAGALALVPADERVTGPGARWIMAAFTHVPPKNGRFHDGGYGVYYAARDLETAIAEAVHHRAGFLAATREPPMELVMQALETDLAGELHDIRGLKAELPGIYDPDDYQASHALARRLRSGGSAGIVYESVRRPGGECAAIFRPRLLSRPRPTRLLTLTWDGDRITDVTEVRANGLIDVGPT